MNSEQINNGLLINELQLGPQLNTAVQNGTRQKFNLLLSFLSHDAQDFAQFSLPSSKQSEINSINIRKELRLPPEQPIETKGMPPKQAKQYNADVETQNLVNIRLGLLLNNEPVLSRQQISDFPTEIIDNLSLLNQQRLTQSHPDKIAEIENSIGINHDLMESYKALDLENRPLKVTYM